MVHSLEQQVFEKAMPQWRVPHPNPKNKEQTLEPRICSWEQAPAMAGGGHERVWVPMLWSM